MTTKGGYMYGDYDYDSKSFYIQDTTNVNSKLTTSFGYRHNDIHDHIDIDGPLFNSNVPQKDLLQAGVDPYHLSSHETSNVPVFNFNYALNEKTALHGAVGKSYRFPNAKERSGVGGYYNGVLSTYLLPETAINREVGLSHSFNSKLGFDITLFNKDIDNMIKGQGAGYQHTQYENIPHVDMHGFEAEFH
ncbi:hypothetical protein SPSIL_040980 [Sporomusa silvacetica DSM 10669]|uniref:TonB-dependent receptor-like beta-barrel domain-containing protein n=2 Tax=Sporomusa silvacetica TaxID=55504 RepID=A0ABZ3IQG3_9FIRM